MITLEQANEKTPRNIDFTKRFLPEKFTPLYFTPIYATLSEAQKLRYNQLHGLYFNEMIGFFETSLSESMFKPLLCHSACRGMESKLKKFLEEESNHSRGFLELNHRCAPEFYPKLDFHFIKLSRYARWLGNRLTGKLDWFPFFIWITLIQEERAIHYGNEFLKSESVIEDSFKEIQRRHLADEAEHCSLGEQLLDIFWQNCPLWIRQLNVRLLRYVFREYYTTPKRTGLNVVDAWILEFPELARHCGEIKRFYRIPESNPEYMRSLYNSTNIPNSLKLMTRYPELDSFIADVDQGFLK